MTPPLLLALLLQTPAPPPGVEELRIAPVPDALALVDVDGDGPAEILAVLGRQLRVVRPATGLEPVEFPGEATLWTVADHDGDGREDLLALVDGDALLRLELADGRLGWSEPLFLAGGQRRGIPRGVRHARFIQDLDGDGHRDLVVPQADRVRLFFGTGQGFRAGPELAVASRLDLEARPGLLGRVRRRLRVPQLAMRDLSGDGLPDLQVVQGLRIRQYLNGPEGLAAEPTVTLDLQPFADRLPRIRFDPSNVAGLARYSVQEEWADLDRDGSQDLLILVGGHVLVYMGSPRGVDLRRRRDQVQTRGNVLHAFAVPVDEDPYPDLLLLRVEDVSLGRILSWYLFSITLDVDLLAYKGLGNGRFAKRPMPQSRRLEVELPALRDLRRQKKSADARRRTVVRVGRLFASERPRDLVVLDERGELRAYAGVVDPDQDSPDLAARILAELLQARSVEVDLHWIYGWLLGRASLLLSLTRDREPVFRFPPPAGWEPPQAMTTRDLDGDGRDEVLALRLLPARDGQPAVLVGYLLDPDAFTKGGD